MSPSRPWSPTLLLDCSGRPWRPTWACQPPLGGDPPLSVPQRGLRLSPRSCHAQITATGFFHFPSACPGLWPGGRWCRCRRPKTRR